MPIYAYRCAACGHTKEVLRKISDPPLGVCPACGEPRFEKQVTAAGFQLKGSGWYATDFRNPQAAAKPGENGKADNGAAAKTSSDGAATAAPAAPAAPAAAPAAAKPAASGPAPQGA